MIIFFVEHVSREYYMAKLLSDKLTRIFGATVKVYSINFFTLEVMLLKKVKFIVFPSPNRLIEPLRSFYKCPVFLLNYEQMISDMNKKLKRITFKSKNRDRFISWSDFFTEFLLSQGVSKEQVIRTDRPQFEISLNYFKENTKLNAYLEGKAPKTYKKILFVPLTCLHAFKTDSELKRAATTNSVGLSDLLLRKSSVSKQLFDLYSQLSQSDNTTLYIIRPHPSISKEQHHEFLDEFKIELPKHIIITNEFNSYEWIYVSDIVVTNYSSLAIESNWLGRPTYLFKTSLLPEFMKYNWFADYICINDIRSIDKLSTGRTVVASENTLYSNTIIDYFKINKDIYDSDHLVQYSGIFKLLVSKRFYSNLTRILLLKLLIKDKIGVYEDYFKAISFSA